MPDLPGTLGTIVTIPPISGDPPNPHSSPRDAIRPGGTLAERYVIQRELGAGGMATVYLAEDFRHHRPVAIKVLHAELSAVLGPERFLKEIEVTASLQHPHILPLFDSGSVNGLLYYVMPYVEGETLRARLAREKQLPVAEAVRIASEVASALDYAHRRGVVHRDIKPENILLHDGSALVADFGIALAVKSAGGERMTQTGLSLGTPQYMSPEQAMGEREIGPRSDVYSLGAVTYEMLVGEAPFTGPTAQAIVAKVLTEEPPDVTAQRRSVPPHVSDAVRIALAKLPADRFADAKSFAEALAAPGAATRGVYHAASTAPGRRVAALTALLVVAILASAAGWIAWYRASRATVGNALPTRLALLVPTLGGSGVGTTNRSVTLTRDGATLLYVAGHLGDGSDGGLRRQSLDEETPTPIPLTDRVGYAPSVSPDGRRVATRNQAGALMLYPTIGPSRTVSPVGSGFAFYAWNPDGTLWVTQTPYRRIDRVAPGSDSLQQMLVLDRGAWIQETYPAVTHDGRWLAFVSGQSGRDEVYVRPLADSGSVVQISQGGGTEPVWSRSGRELFYRGLVNGAPTLISASIETKPSFVVAARQPLFPMTAYLSSIPHANYDVSPDGESFAMVRANAASRIVVLQNLPALMARTGRPRELAR